MAQLGETFDHTVTWKIDDVAVNVTGYTARLQIRKRHTSTATVASLTSGSGLTLGGTAGTIQIVLSATATAANAIASPSHCTGRMRSDGTKRGSSSAVDVGTNEFGTDRGF